MNKKPILNHRNLYSICMIMLMILIAETIHEKEIIFPEIAALVIGAWSMERQPWNVDRPKMILLMSISALFGICIVRYLAVSVYLKVLIAFSFTSLSLMISRTSLVPMISACILPILLGTTSMIYPFSVCIMTVVITGLQWILEINHKKEARTYIKEPISLKEEGADWVMRFILLALISYFPIETHNYYFIAPPVIVTFVEFTFLESKARKQPLKILSAICIASFIGFICRSVFGTMFHLPLTVCGVLAIISLMIAFRLIHAVFPPAGAIALLPLILPAKNLYLYPLQVSIGTSIFIFCALFFFRTEPQDETVLER